MHACPIHSGLYLILIFKAKVAQYSMEMSFIIKLGIIVFVSVSHCKTVEHRSNTIFGLFARHADVHDISRIAKVIEDCLTM